MADPRLVAGHQVLSVPPRWAPVVRVLVVLVGVVPGALSPAARRTPGVPGRPQRLPSRGRPLRRLLARLRKKRRHLKLSRGETSEGRRSGPGPRPARLPSSNQTLPLPKSHSVPGGGQGGTRGGEPGCESGGPQGWVRKAAGRGREEAGARGPREEGDEDPDRAARRSTWAQPDRS